VLECLLKRTYEYIDKEVTFSLENFIIRILNTHRLIWQTLTRAHISIYKSLRERMRTIYTEHAQNQNRLGHGNTFNK